MTRANDFIPQPSPLITIPDARPARWALLLELIAEWYGPIVTEDGYDDEVLKECETQAGISFPLAMREWHGSVGRRDDVWSRQDTLIHHAKLRLEGGGILEFYVENQSVTSWGIRESDMSIDDPPVVVRDEEDRWVVQSPQFSEFALHMFTFAIQFGKHLAQIHGYTHSTCVQRLDASFPKLAFPEFIWTRSRLSGFQDLIVSIDRTDHVSASARSPEAISPFQQLIGEGDFEILAENIEDSTNGH